MTSAARRLVQLVERCQGLQCQISSSDLILLDPFSLIWIRSMNIGSILIKFRYHWKMIVNDNVCVCVWERERERERIYVIIKLRLREQNRWRHILPDSAATFSVQDTSNVMTSSSRVDPVSPRLLPCTLGPCPSSLSVLNSLAFLGFLAAVFFLGDFFFGVAFFRMQRLHPTATDWRPGL